MYKRQLHRGLGTHLSFVRSVTLDEWTQKQANVMQLWGNANANSFFEARMPADFKKPDQHASVNVMNKFIRDKYERCKWAADDPAGDPRRGGKPAAAGGAAAAAPPAAAPAPAPRAASRPAPRAAPRRPAPAPKPAAPPPPDLLSFDAPEPAAPAAPPAAPSPADFFGAPVSAPPPPAAAPPPAPPQSDLIMSMFNQPMQQPQAFGGMPGGFGAKLSAFQRMLVVRTLRENFTIAACREVVREALRLDLLDVRPRHVRVLHAQ